MIAELTPLIYAEIPWLSWSLLILLLGMGFIVLVGKNKARYVALITHLCVLLFTILVTFKFDPSQPGFQLVEKYQWISSLNINYFFGVDGLSILFLPATALLFCMVTLANWNNIQSRPRAYYALMLLLELSIIGVFISLDTILFVLFWEMTLIPLYFLLSLWGIGIKRRYAGTKYVLFMLTGGLPIVFAFMLLALQPDGSILFDYPELLKVVRDNPYQNLIFFLLLFGFGVKTPLFPMHTWLPVLAQEGHSGTIAIVAGIKIGAYGLLRFTIPMAPDAALQYQWLLIALGIIGVIYGAVAALGQTNLRRMLAFSSISHVGMVVLGIATFSQAGLQGAILLLLSLILVTGGLFLLSGFLYNRVGSTEMIQLGGIAQSMPLLTAFFLFFGFASMAIPGTSAFPAELLIIISTLDHYAGVGLASLFGIILGAAYFLEIFRRSFLGPCQNVVIAEAVDLKLRELIIVFLMSIIILLVGFYPQSVFNVLEAASQHWVTGLNN